MNLKKIIIVSLMLGSLNVFAYEPIKYTFDDGVYKKR